MGLGEYDQRANIIYGDPSQLNSTTARFVYISLASIELGFLWDYNFQQVALIQSDRTLHICINPYLTKISKTSRWEPSNAMLETTQQFVQPSITTRHLLNTPAVVREVLNCYCTYIYQIWRQPNNILSSVQFTLLYICDVYWP